MKIILGDNQFFGVNHFDLKKGDETKKKFNTSDKIVSFINKSLEIGFDGFMINSNSVGYHVINNFKFNKSKEIHYSIPYPHKYANMVNENGMLSLLIHLIQNTSTFKNIIAGSKLLFTRNLKSLTSLALNLEIPKNLKKGSHIYLQNIITDLLIGLGREDIIIEFIRSVQKIGYRPGIITLNPIILNRLLISSCHEYNLRNLIVCFNINKIGFNVFPSQKKVEEYMKLKHSYKLMGMSIFASGGSQIKDSINYVKKFELDYVVFGSSNIDNIKNNLELLRS